MRADDEKRLDGNLDDPAKHPNPESTTEEATTPSVSSARRAVSKSLLWAAPLVGKTLALRPELVDLIQGALAAGESPTVQAAISVEGGDEPQPGIIPLYGLITPHGSWLSLFFGGSAGGLDLFRARLAEAVADDNVSHIVIDVDSPGGLADLVAETAADVRAARDVKPVIAVANTLAASAAYWIASQATEFVVTPSGMVGSIGVYMMHTDWSRADEMDGIKTTLVAAGKYKAERSPYFPLSNEAKKAMQQDVDDLYGMFVADVALGRSVSTTVVEDNFGQGRTLTAERAVSAGMADRVGTLEEVVGGIVQSPIPDDEGENEPETGESADAGARRPATKAERKEAFDLVN